VLSAGAHPDYHDFVTARIGKDQEQNPRRWLDFVAAHFAFLGNPHFLEMQVIANIPSRGRGVVSAFQQGDFDHAPPKRQL
jgi:hypothetical protein